MQRKAGEKQLNPENWMVPQLLSTCPRPELQREEQQLSAGRPGATGSRRGGSTGHGATETAGSCQDTFL